MEEVIDFEHFESGGIRTVMELFVLKHIVR